MSDPVKEFEPVEGEEVVESRIYVASQWKLMWWRFTKHKMAVASGIVLLLLFLLAIFCEFFSVYDPNTYDSKYSYMPPQRIRFFGGPGPFRPYVYGFTLKLDPETLRKRYVIDTAKVYPVRILARGEAYKLWGLWTVHRRLIGVGEGHLFLLGTDRLGRDLFSRILYGARISMSIGLIGVFLSMVLGVVIGGLSGYVGGILDRVVQRVIEVLRCVPTIPLWMALSAALPAHWPPLRVYFAITLILSFVSWTGLARVVRSKFLSLREEDFVLAARLIGAGKMRIVLRHMVPSFLSYIIASVTLSIPHMILGETSLSFLGIGLRAPIVSWGVLLQEAQNVRTVTVTPWLLIPGLFVIVTVLAYNFLGDGLRDAADPYGQ